MKVDFIVLGAMKCGTSSLSTILSLHPDISFSKPKEPHFFSNKADWKERLDQYHSYFPKKGRLYGEGSTSYTKYPVFNHNIWDKIFEYNDNMKFIYLIRNPIERTISHYVHCFQLGQINTSLEDSIVNNPDILNFSRYYTQVIPFVRKFGRENVFIILFEEFIKNQTGVIKDVMSFLGVDFIEITDNITSIHANKSYTGRKERPYTKYKGSLLPKMVKKISPSVWRKFYVPTNRYFAEKPKLTTEYKSIIINMLELEILAMQELTGKDLSNWLIAS